MSWELEEAKKLPPSAFFKPLKSIPLTRGLKVLLWGAEETGKTYFCCSAPDPVYIIDTEFGAAKVARVHFPDKEIYIHEVRVQEALDPSKIDYIATFKEIARAVQALAEVEEGTICIDNISDVYTWLNAWVEETAVQRTTIGRPQRLEWARRNILYRNLVFRLLCKPVHVVLTAQPQRVYGPRGEETAQFMPRWLQPQPHWSDIVIHLEKQTAPGRLPRYVGTITKCRFMRTFNKQIQDITFDKLVKCLEKEFGVKCR